MMTSYTSFLGDFGLSDGIFVEAASYKAKLRSLKGRLRLKIY